MPVWKCLYFGKFKIFSWVLAKNRGAWVLSHFVRDWAILSTRQMSTKINHGSVIRVTLNNISLRALIVQTTSTSAFTCHFQIKSRHYPSHFHSHCQLRLKKVDNSYICKVRLKKESCSQNTLLYPLLPKSNPTPPPPPPGWIHNQINWNYFFRLGFISEYYFFSLNYHCSNWLLYSIFV